jgi:hypothetical protein
MNYLNETIDTCTYAWPKIYEFTTSNITDFKIVPIDTGVG